MQITECVIHNKQIYCVFQNFKIYYEWLFLVYFKSIVAINSVDLKHVFTILFLDDFL